ncbi:hypothetical protein ATANTOWER_010247 [Ataeniobius toweri]|uniref:Uncharacterized protein n=1 Tax=Ataeniobius toweri TaxID=208326 RepID=A0ABU7ASY2_9TELE|nr:hypothetical protein [Ataeniobius toweri]
MALWSKSSPASSLQICASVASTRETRWKWQHDFFFLRIYNPGDVRAAMSVELRISNCATKMDDSNTALMSPSPQTSPPVPVIDKHSCIMLPPPPCFTVKMVLAR